MSTFTIKINSFIRRYFRVAKMRKEVAPQYFLLGS